MSEHNKKVREEASKLRKKGYKVKADLPGETRPPAIDHRRPDIYAERGKKKLAKEIETSKSAKREKNTQDKELAKSAKKHGIEFDVVIAKKKSKKK